MTPKQERALIRQIDAIGQALGLHGWSIELADTPSSEGTQAEVTVTFGQRHAVIFLCADWLHLSASRRHHVLCHEMLHIVQEPAFTYLRETLPDIVGASAWTAIHGALRQHHENTTDQLATALAALLPVGADA